MLCCLYMPVTAVNVVYFMRVVVLIVKRKFKKCLLSDGLCSLISRCASGPYISEFNLWPLIFRLT